MKESMAKKMVYIGAGAGTILFVLYGLLPGSFLGGIAGLSLAGALFGQPVEPGLLTRVMVALSMLTGVMVSGLIFVTAASFAGWILGSVVDAVRSVHKRPVTADTRH